MKKVFGILAVAGLFVATSCTGNYDCDCTYQGMDITAASWEGVKKDDAQTSCDALETNYQLVDASASCTLNKK